RAGAPSHHASGAARPGDQPAHRASRRSARRFPPTPRPDGPGPAAPGLGGGRGRPRPAPPPRHDAPRPARARASGARPPRGPAALAAGRARQGAQLAGQLKGRLEGGVRRETGRRRRAVEALAARLDSLSPLACLARGYAIAVLASGEVLTRAGRVRVGEQVTV